MGSWTTVIGAAGLLAAAGIGVGAAPPGKDQVRVARQVQPARVQVMAGAGSWIGLSVRDVATDDV